jgi:hypothetical protein
MSRMSHDLLKRKLKKTVGWSGNFNEITLNIPFPYPAIRFAPRTSGFFCVLWKKMKKE